MRCISYRGPRLQDDRRSGHEGPQVSHRQHQGYGVRLDGRRGAGRSRRGHPTGECSSSTTSSGPPSTMFDCNWVLVLENTMDSHNAFMVHRNALRILKSRLGGRPRTPFGYRVTLVNEKTVHYRPGEGKSHVEKYYEDDNGIVPYQMYYPGVDGVWPLHRWRLLWTWIFDRKARSRGQIPGRLQPKQASSPDVNEWNGTRLPGMSRTGGNNEFFRSTRWAVPVEANLTRMVYLNVERYASRPGMIRRLWSGVTWPYRNWELNFNFRNQDYDAEKYVQYASPEYLSSTDSVVVAMRRLFVEHARGRAAPPGAGGGTPRVPGRNGGGTDGAGGGRPGRRDDQCVRRQPPGGRTAAPRIKPVASAERRQTRSHGGRLCPGLR